MLTKVQQNKIFNKNLPVTFLIDFQTYVQSAFGFLMERILSSVTACEDSIKNQ